MKERFIKLWKDIGGIGNPISEYEKLSQLYNFPQRYYHNLNHIKNCLTEFDSAKTLIPNPNLVEFALWYHDAIYSPQANDDEERSAQLVYNICLNKKFSKEFAKDARELVLVTKHNFIPKGLDAKFMVDIDLSILGKPSLEFEDYEKKIRKEYFWVTENEFRQGRRTILQKFLKRESIYLTDFFKDKYEILARSNLERSIENLKPKYSF